MPRIDLGADDLEVGGVRIVPHREGVPPNKSLILVRAAAGLRCFWNVCKHLPIPLDGGVGTLPPGDRLVCITHGASYRTDDGHCESGPCEGEDLEGVPITVEDGRIYALVGV
jgi:nitrite reductase/ring-hydroxylating ferredoxin subunit